MAPNIEHSVQSHLALISACRFYKRSLCFLSVVPPLLHETPFTDESDFSRLAGKRMGLIPSTFLPMS